MSEMYFIAAIDDKNGLARGGKLPWDLPEDRAYFREKVLHGPVVMGSGTFRSSNFRPFGTGKNYVLTRSTSQWDGVEVVHEIDEIIKGEQEPLWVVGGGQIFTLLLPNATKLFLTRVEGDFDCDVFFPEFDSQFTCVERSEQHEQNGIRFVYEVWERKVNEE